MHEKFAWSETIIHLPNNGKCIKAINENVIKKMFNFQDIVEVEAGAPVQRPQRKRKTSQNDHSHGSFFLRIGAIGNFF